jgi:hypothetical protein
VLVENESKLSRFSAPVGGFAFNVMEAKKEETKGLKKLK